MIVCGSAAAHLLLGNALPSYTAGSIHSGTLFYFQFKLPPAGSLDDIPASGHILVLRELLK